MVSDSKRKTLYVLHDFILQRGMEYLCSHDNLRTYKSCRWFELDWHAAEKARFQGHKSIVGLEIKVVAARTTGNFRTVLQS